MPMNYGKALLAAFLLLSLSLNSCAKGDPYAREMRSAATYSALTSANHPRLFADDEEFARIREAVLEGGAAAAAAMAAPSQVKCPWCGSMTSSASGKCQYCEGELG